MRKYKLTLLLLVTLFTTSVAQAERRIVGGYDVNRGDWPWMVALVTKWQTPYTGQFCGGTLISPEWVVTAAHCVIDESRYSFKIIQGIYNINTDRGNGIGQSVNVKRIIVHPRYNDFTLNNDIALVQLMKPLQVTTIPVVNAQLPLTGLTATVVGWGDTTGNEDYPYWLQQVDMPIISDQVCRVAYRQKNPPEYVTKNMFCAGYAQGGQDSCQGDSGGPLMVYQNGRYYLAGIVSSGDGCALPDSYGIYTRISNYQSFIDSYVH